MNIAKESAILETTGDILMKARCKVVSRNDAAHTMLCRIGDHLQKQFKTELDAYLRPEILEAEELTEKHDFGCDGTCETMPNGELACATPIEEI